MRVKRNFYRLNCDGKTVSETGPRLHCCACHNSSIVMACATLWSDWIIRPIIRSKLIFERFELWAGKCSWNGFSVIEPPYKAIHHRGMHTIVGKEYLKDTSKGPGTVGADHYMLDWNHRGVKLIKRWNHKGPHTLPMRPHTRPSKVSCGVLTLSNMRKIDCVIMEISQQ